MRVMWLLNHSSARKFEIPMLKRIGINEIFLPKTFPQEVGFRSASVDYSEDEFLTIPQEDLEVLNAEDWYGEPSVRAWKIANKYFDVVFFIAQKSELLGGIAKNFKGVAILRAYGLDQSLTYQKLINHHTGATRTLEDMGARFFFGEAYSHLHEKESAFIKNHSIYLPLGLHNCALDNDKWIGSDSRIFFVCPDIGFNSYYKRIYSEFKRDFRDFPHVIGGSQPVSIPDASVLGYVSSEHHARNMREMRLMFYHSTEPNHVHYHPFEAVRAGMPLVFMGGGMLDRLGGVGLPGRCETIREAQRKIGRILKGDTVLIDSIRASQPVLLDPMRPESCEQAWREGWRRIESVLERTRGEACVRPTNRARKRVAVFLPVAYRGGTLRGAKLLAQAVHEGSRQAGEDVEVVFAHEEDPAYSAKDVFKDLPADIKRRTFRWRELARAEALRAMRYAGHEAWVPCLDGYIVPDDGMQQFTDCALWLFVSDRMSWPLLPLRPHACMVYDYIQRRVDVLPPGVDRPFLHFAQQAKRVLVTTELTERDAVAYAGVPAERVKRVPPLVPLLVANEEAELPAVPDRAYFLWTTNFARHKNHFNAIQALKLYYEDLGGALDCHVTGVGTRELMRHPPEHLRDVAAVYTLSPQLRRHVKWKGELSERSYFAELAAASFLWHPAKIDNGTFSVIEAAANGVPSLTSDYPPMRELDERFGLHLSWMQAEDPWDMANQLKRMEKTASAMKMQLPKYDDLAQQGVGQLAGDYWKVLRECM